MPMRAVAKRHALTHLQHLKFDIGRRHDSVVEKRKVPVVALDRYFQSHRLTIHVAKAPASDMKFARGGKVVSTRAWVLLSTEAAQFQDPASGYKPCLDRICARKSRSASEVAITAVTNALVSAADIIS